MDTKGGKWRGRGGGVMNWETGIDIYTLICIQWITNKNLLYKKINKIKFKNSKKKGLLFYTCGCQGGRRGRGGLDWEFGVSRYKLYIG